MSDFTTVKAQLRKLLDDANTKTEKADVDLTSAVGTLIEGYGAGESIPDGESVTFGYVSEEAGEAYYNDVLFPIIPKQLLENYPKCLIVKQTETIYWMLAGSYTWYYTNRALKTTVGAYVLYKYNVGDESWTYVKTNNDNGNYGVALGVTWSNHDILNGSETSTDIYFAGSEAAMPEVEYAPAEREPLYSVTSDNLNDIAYRVGQLAGSIKLMTPSEMVTHLNNIPDNDVVVIPAEDIAFSSEHNDADTALYATGYNWFADLVSHVQDMSGSSKDMTPEDVLYWLGRVKYVEQAWAISNSNILLNSVCNAKGE